MSKKAGATLLEQWRPPVNAGEPVGCLTTTYTFDPGFFEEECLARFLGIDSLPNREGVAYLLERENRLGSTYAGVLVDTRMAGVDHTLRWDVLPVRVPAALQHAKLTVLAWQKVVRVLITSANCTPSGYRSNHEVFGALEYSAESCDKERLTQCREFLGRVVDFVPGTPSDHPPVARVLAFLDQVGKQVARWQQPSTRGKSVLVFPVFTAPTGKTGKAVEKPIGTLGGCLEYCWQYGRAPDRIKIASPFFDEERPDQPDQPTTVLANGMARGRKRVMTLCVSRGNESDAAMVRVAAPKSLYTTARNRVDTLGVELLPATDADKNLRPWHVKMMLFEDSETYRALYIGSANYTSAGLGVGTRNNFEAGLLYLVRHEHFGRQANQLEESWPETEPVKNPEKLEWSGTHPLLGEEVKTEAMPIIPAGFISAVYQVEKLQGQIFTIH